ncbi:hypothetical protein NC652_020806 [Populus alba x Populus x berolinensis]|nr:hypothetical protein NC652_020806 [Populus alba x Populus x berolinensis]
MPAPPPKTYCICSNLAWKRFSAIHIVPNNLRVLFSVQQQKEEKKERVPIVTIRDRDFSFEECRVQTIQKDWNGNLELE